MTIPGHATNDEPCDICEHPIGASRETHHRHVICAPCSSYVASARKYGGARAGAALAAAAAPRASAAAAAPAAAAPAAAAPFLPQSAAAPSAAPEASFIERIAAEMERQQGKGDALGSASADATDRQPGIAGTKEPGGKTLLEQIADGIEAQTKRDPNAPTSVHNINLGISYTP